ncbi:MULTISPECIES: tetratricopeptide repeat protein [unclassified Rhizobium]|uniref:tetratricopeptide repeat protein n=1 Tax=unclassified Rhizobium TaxID=2613769 RepID=UPI001C82D5A7|nr:MULTISPECIES: tetratricopeptide repeat protein [unclassified Rhizobium]MBX5164923.1 hypothetical protein [Rhizobium sp. NZLR4b]MBX5170058.1 hypothetical protein [Rhizobium sp. NZLR1b]MBX5209738.1 hypothetical protein [Rhizobium sp. NZLR11]
MSAEVRDADTVKVTTADAEAELGRLIADVRFHATERQKAILIYLAEKQIAGCDDSTKAYAIAIDVLGRPSGFDPSTDPIVRIEMSRLRSAVSNYYEAFGVEGDVVIGLPKGRYVADFNRVFLPAEVGDLERGEEIAAEEPELTSGSSPAHGFRMSARAALFAIAGAIVAAGAGATLYGRQPVFTQQPVVAISIQAADDDLRGEASQTRDLLLTALTRFQTLTVSASAPPPPSSRLGVYRVEMKYYSDGDERMVWWQVLDGRAQDVLRSGIERVEADGRTPVAARAELVAILARRFAATRGVINNIELHETSSASLGNACVLRAEYLVDEGGSGDMAQMADCLGRTIAADPLDTDAMATLSRLLLAPAGAATDPAIMRRAIALANRAVSLAPLSDRAQMALMAAHFFSGRTEAAIGAGNRALALNPNNPEVSAKLALVLYFSGFWEAGSSLAQDAGRSVDSMPRDAQLVLALDAYRSNDWSEASLLAEQINFGDDLVRAIRAASLGELGSDQAKGRLADLRASSPGFESDLFRKLEARGVKPSITASLEAGLTKAGASFTSRGVAVAD